MCRKSVKARNKKYFQRCTQPLLQISRCHAGPNHGTFRLKIGTVVFTSSLCFTRSVPPSIRGSDEVSPLTVTVGGLVTLLCESSGIPPPSLTWKKNGKIIIILFIVVVIIEVLIFFYKRFFFIHVHVGSELKADSRVRVLSGGRQLQITSAERSDAASYTCQASSVTGTAVKEYSLQVYGTLTLTSLTLTAQHCTN